MKTITYHLEFKDWNNNWNSLEFRSYFDAIGYSRTLNNATRIRVVPVKEVA